MIRRGATNRTLDDAMTVAPLRFPRRVPPTVAPLVAPVLNRLPALIPEAHAGRVDELLCQLPVASTRNLLLELALPPARPACDLSLLLRDGMAPPLATPPRHFDLEAVLNAAAALDASVWWEYDTSHPHAPAAYFLRGISSITTMSPLVTRIPGGPEALKRLADLTDDHVGESDSLVGVLVDRAPPAFSRIFTVAPDDAPRIVSALAPLVSEVVDCRSPVARHLLATCEVIRLSVAVTTSGRTSVSIEAFASADSRPNGSAWTRVIRETEVWGQRAAPLHDLLDMQQVHIFSSLLPSVLACEISHLKIAPAHRLKAYLGLHPFMVGSGA